MYQLECTREGSLSEMREGSSGVYICRKSPLQIGIKASSEEHPLLLTQTPADNMSAVSWFCCRRL